MVERKKKPETKRSPLKGTQTMIEVGNAILSCAMNYQDVLTEIDLISEYFPLAWQQDVWVAITALYDAKSKVDILMVAEHLEMSSIECPDGKWLAFLASTMRDSEGVSRNVQHYVDSLVSWQRRSRCSEIGQKLVLAANDGEDGSDDAIRELMAMSTSNRVMDGPLGESIHEAVDALDARCSTESKIHGIPYGIAGLDKALAGIHPGDLVVVGARPSMGKTAFALGICARNPKVPIGFISTEQPRRQMIDRLVCMIGEVDSHNMRTGTLTDEEFGKATGAYSAIQTMPLYMNDKPGPDISDVIRQARKWKHRYGIKVLIVDYIQRVKSKNHDKRHEEVGYIVSSLKNLARELDIGVIALSQINREIEKRPNKRPVMSDLRESGDIEQEADVITTMYRDEVYNEDPRTKGQAEFGLPKNRHGPTGKVICGYEGRYFQFKDVAFDEQDFGLPPVEQRGTRDAFSYRPDS